jgi:hypothetical protein
VAVAAAGAPLLPVFFGAARGEVVVSSASASAAASAAAFLSTLRRVDLEKFEYSVCPRSIQLRDGVFILLQGNRSEDEVSVSLHLPLLQHCG